MTKNTHTAIIGAGPYGLAAAAHLRDAGINIHQFGRPMSFWQQHMPAGMFLRSSWAACHIADPHHSFSLDVYQASQGRQLTRPVPLDDFVSYGQWFQRAVVPDLDGRMVKAVSAVPGGFELELEDGDSLRASRVVVAAGISSFAHRPRLFHEVPPDLVSHASEHSNLGIFAGQSVLVVGAGQSATESAAILHKSGATVELVARREQINWLQRSGWLHRHLGKILYPPTDVGPPGLNWIVAMPGVFQRFPEAAQRWIAYRSIGPAAAGWLKPRLAGVHMTMACSIASVAPRRDRVVVKLSDGTERCVDHILLATGYRVDITQYPFLAPPLLRAVQAVKGYPTLGPGFESSVPGLHFLGAPAARSFGPLMRFVSGTPFAARSLTRAICERSAPPAPHVSKVDWYRGAA